MRALWVAVGAALVACASGATRIVTWGEGVSDDRSLESVDLALLVASSSSFAALKSDGRVETWGDASSGGDSAPVDGALSSFGGTRAVLGNRMAFAAVKLDGSVVTWPQQTWSGGDSSAVQSQLTDVAQVFGNAWTFVAAKQGGELVAWGDEYYGGKVPSGLDMSVPVVSVVSTKRAHAVLREDGSVVAFGESSFGGDASAVASQLAGGVEALFATEGGAFAALAADGGVVTWGNARAGGDSSAVQAALVDVEHIVATYDAFAAITRTGGVVAWGDAASGGDTGAVQVQLQKGVTEVVATKFAFAARKQDGTLRTWGDPLYGGDSSATGVRTRIVAQVVATPFAFAARSTKGVVEVWGDARYGGAYEPFADFAGFFALTGGFLKCSSQTRTGTFAADTVEACAELCAVRPTCGYMSFNWDDRSEVLKRCSLYTSECADEQSEASHQDLYELRADAADLAERQGLSANTLGKKSVAALFANDWAFAAVTRDGNVITWGDPERGGTLPSGIDLDGTVRDMRASRSAFAAILST